MVVVYVSSKVFIYTKVGGRMAYLLAEAVLSTFTVKHMKVVLKMSNEHTMVGSSTRNMEEGPCISRAHGDCQIRLKSAVFHGVNCECNIEQ